MFPQVSACRASTTLFGLSTTLSRAPQHQRDTPWGTPQPVSGVTGPVRVTAGQRLAPVTPPVTALPLLSFPQVRASDKTVTAVTLALPRSGPAVTGVTPLQLHPMGSVSFRIGCPAATRYRAAHRLGHGSGPPRRVAAEPISAGRRGSGNATPAATPNPARLCRIRECAHGFAGSKSVGRRRIYTCPEHARGCARSMLGSRTPVRLTCRDCGAGPHGRW